MNPQAVELHDGALWGPWASGADEAQQAGGAESGSLPQRVAGKVGWLCVTVCVCVCKCWVCCGAPGFGC